MRGVQSGKTYNSVSIRKFWKVASCYRNRDKLTLTIYFISFSDSRQLVPSGFIQKLLHTYCACLPWLKEFSKSFCGHRNRKWYESPCGSFMQRDQSFPKKTFPCVPLHPSSQWSFRNSNHDNRKRQVCAMRSCSFCIW